MEGNAAGIEIVGEKVRHFIKIGEVDIIPALVQLDAHPELWNVNRDRKDRDNTAHSEMSDIWLRYFPRDELTCDDDFKRKNVVEWYPAINSLTEIRNIIFPIMAKLRATSLGGCLITKLAPGAKILPHTDKGNWHPEHFTTKVYIPLKANNCCYNVTEDETLVMRAGEAWVFSNLKVHSVENQGKDDRITLILSMRCD